MILASPAREVRARGFLLDAQGRVLDAPASLHFGRAFDPRSSAR
jgi:predicted methyltransferase